MRGGSQVDGSAERAEEHRREAKQKIRDAEEAEKLLNGANLVKTADLRAELAARSVPPLEEEELQAVSLIFNLELEHMFPGHDRNRSWISMFDRIDQDFGMITYDELQYMIRGQLHIGPAGLADDILKGLWCTDADESDFITKPIFPFHRNKVPKDVIAGADARRKRNAKRAHR